MTLARVRIAALGVDASALGFGCASLGSRIAPAAGLAALSRAYDAGVTWFDVAPSYGDGQAEILLGRFLADHRRDSVQILTKVGIAPLAPSMKARLLRPAVRVAVSAMPGLRAVVRKRRPAAAKLPLDVALITQSLDASLRRIGTDHVDVLALHDATPEEAAREDVLAALEKAVISGKARTVAIASSPQAAVAGVKAGGCYGLVQMGNNLFNPGLARFRAAATRSVDLVTHSVFGSEGAVSRISARIAGDAALQARLAAAGYQSNSPAVAANDLLADFAFIGNPGGVVVVSMFAEQHLRHNLTRYALHRDPVTVRTLVAEIRNPRA